LTSAVSSVLSDPDSTSTPTATITPAYAQGRLRERQKSAADDPIPLIGARPAIATETYGAKNSQDGQTPTEKDGFYPITNEIRESELKKFGISTVPQ